MVSNPFKPVRPKLPEEYRQHLERGFYTPQVELIFASECSNDERRVIAHPVAGAIRVELWNPDTDDSELVDIGSIWGWRTLSPFAQDIVLWSNSISQSVHDAFAWLLVHQTEIEPEDVLWQPSLFLERVVIEPMWRGLGITLPAVATYLDLIACPFVFFQPAPLDSSELPTAERQRISRNLRRYWQKLGFEYYDAQYNMMWTAEWACPEWLGPGLLE